MTFGEPDGSLSHLKIYEKIVKENIQLGCVPQLSAQ